VHLTLTPVCEAGCAGSGGLSTHCTNYVAAEESSGSGVIFFVVASHFRGRCADLQNMLLVFSGEIRSCVIQEMEISRGHKLEVCHLAATANATAAKKIQNRHSAVISCPTRGKSTTHSMDIQFRNKA